MSLNWKRRLISVFIIYHLMAALIAANPEHYLAQKAKPWVIHYIMAFEFGSQWNFFAPEPGPAPIFIQYELMDAQGQSLLASQIPNYPDDFFLRDRQIRRLNVARYLMREENKIYSIFVPWLCKSYPDAEVVKIKRIQWTIPSPMDIQNGSRFFGDDIGASIAPLQDVYCEGRRS
jgi:hypothetical protein